MPKSKIQFQKGLSLPEFLTQYASEEQCRAALFKMRWPMGLFVPSVATLRTVKSTIDNCINAAHAVSRHRSFKEPFFQPPNCP